MTCGAAFTHSLVFEHERSALRRVAFAARVMLAEQGCPAASHGWAFVKIVTVVAADMPVQHWMRMGQLKLCAFIEVALETDLGRPAGIDDRLMRAPSLAVHAPRTVARFAAGILCVSTFGHDARMGCGLEVAHNALMTLGTTFGPDEFCAFDLRRDDGGVRCVG
jgi:hypothetical protein